MKRATLNVEDAAEFLGLSIHSTYEAIRTGQIPSIRIGRRLLVPLARLEQLIGVPTNLEEIDSSC